MNIQEIRKQIANEAKSWLGTPYHHQAMAKGAGVDCCMILIAVYHACGLIPKIDPRPYPPDWHLHRDNERYLNWVMKYAHEVAEPKKGDIAIWKFGRTFSHSAICLDGTEIIHAYIGRGVVLADRQDAELLDREVKFYSLLAAD